MKDPKAHAVPKLMPHPKSLPGAVAKRDDSAPLDVADHLAIVHQQLDGPRSSSASFTNTTIFGSSKSIQIPTRLIPCFEAINPNANWRIGWDVSLLIIISYCSVMIPVDIGLVPLEGVLQKIDQLTTLFFLCDIGLNFHTGYYDDYGNLILRHKYLIRKYLRSWFILDFCSTVPFDLLLGSNSARGAAMLRIMRAAKLVRVLRLLKVAKLKSLINVLLRAGGTSLVLMSILKLSSILFGVFGFHALGGLYVLFHTSK